MSNETKPNNAQVWWDACGYWVEYEGRRYSMTEVPFPARPSPETGTAAVPTRKARAWCDACGVYVSASGHVHFAPATRECATCGAPLVPYRTCINPECAGPAPEPVKTTARQAWDEAAANDGMSSIDPGTADPERPTAAWVCLTCDNDSKGDCPGLLCDKCGRVTHGDLCYPCPARAPAAGTAEPVKPPACKRWCGTGKFPTKGAYYQANGVYYCTESCAHIARTPTAGTAPKGER